jgi:hypothetical protein
MHQHVANVLNMVFRKIMNVRNEIGRQTTRALVGTDETEIKFENLNI